jgi:hypothetical protein
MIATLAHASPPTHLWGQRFGSTAYESGYALATDGEGNAYVTGCFQGTVNFGGSALVSAGSEDIFLAKYDVRGHHLWSTRFGSTGMERSYALAMDASSNVFITGLFEGTVDFGGGGLVSAGGYDIFLAKYDADGIHRWSRSFGAFGPDVGNSVAVDGSGNAIMTGYFNGTVDFGGGNIAGAGGGDIVLAKYTTSGAHQWSLGMGGTALDFGQSVAIDASGHVVVSGGFSGTVNFGGAGLVSAGGNDVFLAKYSSSGAHQWSQRSGSIGNDYGCAVALDASGAPVLSGRFEGTVNFGGSNLVSAGGCDIFLAKYNAGGVHQWSRAFGGLDSDFGNSVVLDASGSVYVAGQFLGTVDFGGGNLVSAGNADVFLSAYDANGVHQWSRRFGGPGMDTAMGVTLDDFGNLVTTGGFNYAMSFGGASLVSAGSYDAFLAKFSQVPAEPAITTITDVDNDQGRRVRVAFTRSAHDDPAAATPVVRYEAFLRDDPTPLVLSGGSRGSLADGWLEVASVGAHAEDAYLMDAPTDADSTVAAGQRFSAFFIRAATDAPSVFFDSPIDSGYSLDNLAPGVPGSLLYNAGQLSWDESSAEDFDYFTVYGADTDDFGSATVVDYGVAPAMDVTSSPYVFYFVTATDFSGNEGTPARVNTLSGTGGGPRSYVLSISSCPNPFNPRTTISYTLPSRGAVTVAIYDARGARAATLVNGEEQDAGAYRIEWDGRAGNGLAASGIYFARIEHSGATRSRKMVLLK